MQIQRSPGADPMRLAFPFIRIQARCVKLFGSEPNLRVNGVATQYRVEATGSEVAFGLGVTEPLATYAVLHASVVPQGAKHGFGIDEATAPDCRSAPVERAAGRGDVRCETARIRL